MANAHATRAQLRDAGSWASVTIHPALHDEEPQLSSGVRTHVRNEVRFAGCRWLRQCHYQHLVVREPLARDHPKLGRESGVSSRGRPLYREETAAWGPATIVHASS